MATEPERSHAEALEASTQDHEHQMARAKQSAEVRTAGRQQLARLLVIVFIVTVWLAQTGYVTYKAVAEPEILVDIEKFIALIGVTGIVAGQIINKLWPQQE